MMKTYLMNKKNEFKKIYIINEKQNAYMMDNYLDNLLIAFFKSFHFKNNYTIIPLFFLC